MNQDDHCVIDIEDEKMDDDSNNFFLRLTGLLNINNTNNLYETKIKSLEEEIKSLRDQNTEYISKIQSYECKNILDLNRKIRSGIPVRFFPYHSNHSVSNPSQINSVDIDLH